MTGIKICGLSRFEDIDYVNQTMPDYVGFVFAKSRRQVDINFAEKLILKLDKNIKKVGIFVDQNEVEVKKTADSLCLDILQFHGNETKEYIRQFAGYKVWKAIGVTCENDIKNINLTDADGILFDSRIDGRFGGTGGVFDWRIIKDIKFNKPIILAGGLDIDNVEEAINTVNPQIVDVSSGVETGGFKDFDKIKNFIEKVRKRYENTID